MKIFLPILLVLLAAPLMAATTPSDNPTRGYAAISCGFDLDDDFVYGGAGDCDICDGTSGTGVVVTDYDGDGDDEVEIYVSPSGSNTGACGGPADPCATVAYAWANRTGTGSFEDAICIGGTTIETTTTNLNVSGAVDTKTRIRSGLEIRDFEYPTDPMMIVGWDQDNDGSYPPFDTDDTAVMDGSAIDLCFESTADLIEMAHFTIRDCGDQATAPGGSSAGVIHEVGNHTYLHDMEWLRININRTQGSNVRVTDADKDDFSFFAVENVYMPENAGYLFRGAMSQSVTTGPMRWDHIHRTNHCADGAGGCSAFDYWGYHTGHEILNGIWDAGYDVWAHSGGASNVVGMNQCARDLHFVNNLMIGLKAGGIQHSDDAFCAAPGRTTGGTVLIDGNEQRGHPDGTQNGIDFFLVEKDAANDANRIEISLTITNNVVYAGQVNSIPTKGLLRGGFANTSSTHDESTQITIVNNTVITAGCSNQGGLMMSASTAARQIEKITIKNNIFENTNNDGDCYNFFLGWAPSSWAEDNNVFDGSGNSNFGIGNTTYTSLASYQSATTGDGPNSTENCDAVFVNEGTQDYHLDAGDTCALDNGATLLTVTDSDYDGLDNRPVNNWDIGADEVEEGEDPPAPDPGDGVVLSGSNLDGSNTQ